MTKHLLALLRASERPDVVNMVSVCGEHGFDGSTAHDAFYAAKSAQAGFAEILSKRLRPEGIRVISLYPPDFRNGDPLSPEWAPRRAARTTCSPRSRCWTASPLRSRNRATASSSPSISSPSRRPR